MAIIPRRLIIGVPGAGLQLLVSDSVHYQGVEILPFRLKYTLHIIVQSISRPLIGTASLTNCIPLLDIPQRFHKAFDSRQLYKAVTLAHSIKTN